MWKKDETEKQCECIRKVEISKCIQSKRFQYARIKAWKARQKNGRNCSASHSLTGKGMMNIAHHIDSNRMEIETLLNRIRKCKPRKSFILLPISKFIIYNIFLQTTLNLNCLRSITIHTSHCANANDSE